MEKRLATTAMGPSTARGMGAPGIVKATRAWLGKVRLSTLTSCDQKDFERWLNRATRKLRVSLPQNAQHWGAARKFLNIYLRGVIYNRYVCEAYQLHHIEPWLEVPLDSHVAKGLRREPGGDVLPRWTTIVGLTHAKSRAYQDFAQAVAHRKGTHRVHLDLRYWRAEQGEQNKD